MLSRRRFLVLGAGAAGVVAAGGLGACGLPDDDRPRAISDPPRDLVPTTATPAAGGGSRVDLYFINAQTNRLRAVRREVEARTPEAVIRQLFSGLPQDSGALNTSIPPDTVLNEARLDGNVLVLDVGPPNGGIVGVESTGQLQAFAQIVFTASALPGVDAVRFTVGGEPLDATTSNGTVRDRPVNVDDYAELAPGRASDS